MTNKLQTLLANHFTQVIDQKYGREDFMSLDLSIDNKDLDSVDISSASEMESYIKKLLRKAQKKVAIGGYLEERGIYRRSNHFNDPKEEERNIHLGVDLWADAGTSVLSAFDARVHSFQNNTNFGDYGPTIILEHHLKEESFYTLYGHLSLESLQHIHKEKKIQKGEVIGWLGKPEVNGDYAPHLHFQIIQDLQEKNGDYPGVCSKSELNFYQENCIDPNLILF